VRRGARLVRPEEAALGAWFALRDLRRWPRFVALLGALVWWPALTRLLPVSVGGIAAYLWAAGVLAIPVLVWLYLTAYRPALRRALHANLSVAAGLPPPGPPDPRATRATRRRMEREGWLRSMRHHRRRGLS
jgi:hypothetical protein